MWSLQTTLEWKNLEEANNDLSIESMESSNEN